MKKLKRENYKMQKPVMLIQAPVATRSGYGSHSRDIVRSLIKMDKYDIKIGSLKWGNCPMNALNDQDPNDKVILDRLLSGALTKQPEVNIEIRVPNEFCAQGKIGKYNIGITAGIETTQCSQEWIEGCNRTDLVIVPSTHAKRVFENTKYTKKDDKGNVLDELKINTPIEVLFEGFDEDIYKRTDEMPATLHKILDSIEEDFNYLYVGHWLKGEIGQDRKDTGMMVKVFLETFKNKTNPPALIMKTSGATFSQIDKEDIMSKIKTIKLGVENAKSLPNIYFLHGDLTDDEVNALYNHPKVKAHISFTKGEGFGRPLLEATLSEKPILASAWSGHLDFLHPDKAILLPGELTNVHPSSVWENVIIPESKWFTVNYPVASKIMLDVWKNYKNYIPRAKAQAKESANFSFNKMTDVFTNILVKYMPKFAEEVKLNLPNLATGGITLPKLKKTTTTSMEI